MLPRTHSPLALEDALESMDVHEVDRQSTAGTTSEWTRLVIDVPPFCVEGLDSAGSARSSGSWSAGKRRKWLALLLLVACVVAAGASVGVVQLVRTHSSSKSSSDPEFQESSWSSTVSAAIADANASISSTFASAKDYYRTAFHFQPKKNWMNDPNGPLFYKGYYHLFYQYNPNDVVWGKPVWAHAVSTDLLHWRYLEHALVPDQSYDIGGVWSGSATFLPDGTPALLYTGNSSEASQLQSMAVPVDASDPLLIKWRKIPENPLILVPEGINKTYFRDPTTAWIGADGKWRALVGSASYEPPDRTKKTGLAFLYTSSDFVNWTQANHVLHSVPLTGMWECPDFYPVPILGQLGLDTSVNGPSVKHVLKVSLDVTRHDYYAVGTYDPGNDTFVANSAEIDAGLGLRYDFGKFYASKTFYDQNKGRRILWGWVNESDSVQQDYLKGWSSLQAIPRTVWLDAETGIDVIQWPVEEVKSLRQEHVTKNEFKLKALQVKKIGKLRGTQLDIEVVFDIPEVKQSDKLFLPTEVVALDAQRLCNEPGSADILVGPFGVLVLAAHALEEYTAVFFSVVRVGDGSTRVLVCSDLSRSSLAPDLDTTSYGSFLRANQSDTQLSLRVLVDHSIVEAFVQGGKISITSRVYPTLALEDDARVYLFNNGSTDIRVLEFNAWKMSTVLLTDFFPS